MESKISRIRSVRPVTPAPEAPRYTANDKEFYLNDDGIAYVRPGVKVKVNSITIGSDRKPVVDLNITDNLDQPLDRLGKVTPGPVGLSFIMAWYNPDTRLYTSYTTRIATAAPPSTTPGVKATQASTDSGGKWTDLEMGHASYKFATALPEGYSQTATTTLVVYGSRVVPDPINKTYYVNLEQDFRPDGAAVTVTWDKIRDGACLNCHDPLALHGGSRRDVKLCVTCHQPQTSDPDTGNSVDMALMIHKIHNGANLEHGYTIIGNRQSVHDYSEVVLPQDVRNCDNCHEGINSTQKPTQSDVYYTYPSRRACGACHDSIDFAAGVGHPAQADDGACANCHVPDSGAEFDASIKGAHTIPLKSKQLAGLKVAFVSATDFEAGKKPTVTFKVTNNAGTAIDGSKLNTFSPIIAGPTSSYTHYYRETGAGKATFDAATGNTTYTFTNAIPEGQKGTWTVSGDFYRTVAIKRADGGADISVRESAYNPIKYIALDGGTATPRRVTVDMALCNECHDRLALHGGQRLVMDECVICHNPVKDDTAQRVAGTGDPESVSMQRMIHRIHSGEELTQDFTVYGNGKSVHNYNEVVYPGDRRNCAACHINSGQQIPPAKGADPVITMRDYFSPQGPGTAACLGCHDSQDAAAHAYLNTTNFGGTKTAEACGVCHGTGADWSVDKVHAR
jgi:OmcA/MtrC family decaheme c-type cytochrome